MQICRNGNAKTNFPKNVGNKNMEKSVNIKNIGFYNKYQFFKKKSHKKWVSHKRKKYEI